MRYSASHKLETREKLLQSSALSAKRSGFSTVGVDGLMKAIGLSGAAFYSHFSSKDALFTAIVERELGQSLERLGGEGTQDRERLARCLKHYLSMAHVEQPEAGCALPHWGQKLPDRMSRCASRRSYGSAGSMSVGRRYLRARAWPGRCCRNASEHWWWRVCWLRRTFSKLC